MRKREWRGEEGGEAQWRQGKEDAGFLWNQPYRVSQKTKLPGEHNPARPQSDQKVFKSLQKLSDSRMYSSKDGKMAQLLQKIVQSLCKDVGDKAKIKHQKCTTILY